MPLDLQPHFERSTRRTQASSGGFPNVRWRPLNHMKERCLARTDLASGGPAAAAFGPPSGDGGPATSATLQGPFGVALDASGNIYISGGALSGYPLGSGYVRKVTTDGIIHTIAGNGATGNSGDGGPGTAASFSAATAGIAVDAMDAARCSFPALRAW